MSTKVKAQPKQVATPLTAGQAAPAAPVFTLSGPVTAVPAYLTEKLDEATGELAQVSRFRYLPGHPRQIRFDAKAGQFNIGGTTPLGNSLRFIPLAWRYTKQIISRRRLPCRDFAESRRSGPNPWLPERT